MRCAVWIVVVLCLFPSLAVADGVRVQVDRTALRLDEYLTMALSIEGGGDPDLTVIQDFAVVGRSTSIQFSLINGKASRTTQYTLTLQPLALGQAEIPPIPVDFDGQVMESERIMVTVEPGYQGPQPGGQAPGSPSQGQPGAGRPSPAQPGADSPQPEPGSSSEPVFLEAYLSKDDIYVGETVLYTLRVFWRVNLIRENLTAPAFDSFHAERLDQGQEYYTTVDGTRYRVAEIRYLLSAARPGRITVEPAVLDCDVVDMSRSVNPLDLILRGPPALNQTVESNGPEILVRELPAYEGDVPFSGLVGTFSLDAVLDAEVIPAGESATLDVTISGQGNVQDASELDLASPPGFKLYADTPDINVRPNGDVFRGTKTFHHVYVPLEPGEYSLGEAALCYFDTEREEYVVLRKELPTLTVIPGESQEMVVAAPDPGQPGAVLEDSQEDKREVDLLHQDILPLKPDRSSPGNWESMDWRLFLLLLLLPPALLGARAAAARLGARKDRLCVRMERRIRQGLAEAESLVGIDNEKALSMSAKAVLWSVHRLSESEGGALTYDEVRRELSRHGKETHADEAGELLKDIDHALYGGAVSDNGPVRDLVDRTRSLVEGICV